MSFDTRPGTRGSRQPGGRLLHWFNRFNARRIRRRGGGKFRGGDALVLRTIGRKSGAERATPVAWFADADDNRLIVASAAGAAGNPAWYYNLAANPDQVRIEVGGEAMAVRAEQLHGAERAQAWERITTASPGFAEYQKQTDRELPIIRLVERS